MEPRQNANRNHAEDDSDYEEVTIYHCRRCSAEIPDGSREAHRMMHERQDAQDVERRRLLFEELQQNMVRVNELAQSSPGEGRVQTAEEQRLRIAIDKLYVSLAKVGWMLPRFSGA